MASTASGRGFNEEWARLVSRIMCEWKLCEGCDKCCVDLFWN